MTIRWHVTETPSTLQLNEIARLLGEGGVVLLPTDTIYGLHANALDPVAVDRVVDIKGRDEKPFVVLAASIEQIRTLGVTAAEERLAQLDDIWPAPLTVILPLREAIAASRGATTVAVRIPALDWLRDLVARTGPLVSTSANRSGEPPVTTPDGLARESQQHIDAIVDAGPKTGEPSAILDLTGSEPRFIREGERSFTQNLRKSLWK